jgi:hypothetical protein
MIMYIWLGVTLALMIGSQVLKSRMLNHRAPGTKILSQIWWGRGFTILTSPQSFTPTGQLYRTWTIRVEGALMLWMFPGALIAGLIQEGGRGYH